MQRLSHFDGFTDGMSTVPAQIVPSTLPRFAEMTPVGLRLAADVSFDEWEAMGEAIGRAVNASCFCIGDWMVYGERKWGVQEYFDDPAFDPAPAKRLPREVVDRAVAATNLDRQSLSQIAMVCRKIPLSERSARISFFHHRVLAPLPTEKRAEWIAYLERLLGVAPNKLPSAKRVALSIRHLGGDVRIISDDELEQTWDQNERAVDNYIPHVQKLVSVLERSLPTMSRANRIALRADCVRLLKLLESI